MRPPGLNRVEYLFAAALIVSEHLWRVAGICSEAVLFPLLFRHAFQGALNAEGVAQGAGWNENVVFIAAKESARKFSACLGWRGLGDRSFEVDIRCDPWEAEVETWDREVKAFGVVVKALRATAAGPPAYRNSAPEYPRMQR